MKMKLDLAWTYIMRGAAEVLENPAAAVTASICKNYAAQISEEIAREALRLAAMKLPVKTRTVVREDW